MVIIYACTAIGCSTPPRSTVVPVTKSSAEVAALFDKHKIASYTIAELNDYCLALFVAGKYDDAIKAARQGFAQSKTNEQKAAFKLHESQQYAALGRYEEAGQVALEGSRLDPQNKLLVGFRLAHFDAAGNTLQAEAARDHLRKLDPEFDRNPVLEPATAVLVITLVKIVALVAAEMVVRIYQEKYAADIELARIARVEAASDTSQFTTPALGSALILSDLSPAK